MKCHKDLVMKKYYSNYIKKGIERVFKIQFSCECFLLCRYKYVRKISACSLKCDTKGKDFARKYFVFSTDISNIKTKMKIGGQCAFHDH